MGKKGRNGQNKQHKADGITTRHQHLDSPSPSNIDLDGTPMTSDQSSLSTTPLSAQTSPLAQVPRQLPTPLPDLPLELRQHSSSSAPRGVTRTGTRARRGEDSPPPTIEVDDDPAMLPALGSSPGALIDFGAASEAHHDDFGGGMYRHDDHAQYFDHFQAQEYDDRVYKSPPFRQALLHEEADEEVGVKEASPSPLPIPPPVLDPDEGEEEMAQGHTRSPIVPPRNPSHTRSYSNSRSPGHSPPSVRPLSPISVASAAATHTFASLSRTIQSYTPSTPTHPTAPSLASAGRQASRETGSPIAIPNAAPYPPALTRPNAQARFSSGRQSSASFREYGEDQHGEEEDFEHGYESPDDSYSHHRVQQQQQERQRSPRSHVSPLPDRQMAWNESQHQQVYHHSGQARNVRGGGGNASVSGVGQTLSGRGGKTRAVVAGGEARYPSAISNEVDRVSWAKWDHVSEGSGGKRLYLLLGYTHGLQIWDTTNFKSVAEVFNVNFGHETLRSLGLEMGDGEVEVVDARVIPPPPSTAKKRVRRDELEGQRPLLGILFRGTSSEGRPRTTFALYSLKAHTVVSKLDVEGYAERFETSERAIVVSTSSPPALHIISYLNALRVAYTIPSSSLASFAHPPTTHSSSEVNLHADSFPKPRPVFALHGRLLAFASPSPSSSSTERGGGSDKRRGSASSSNSSGVSGGTGVSPASGSGSPFGLGVLGGISGFRSQVQSKIPTTQAELGTAALKVGGSVLSGMRFLGGKAVEVAKQQMSKSAPSEGGGLASPVGGGGSERERRRYSSNLSPLSPIEPEAPSKKAGGSGRVGPSTTHRKFERGSLVRVVDLSTVLASIGKGSEGKTPTLVAEFVASRSQTIANLAFGPDGCTILAIPKDGQVTKVFRLEPRFPSTPNPSSSSTSMDEDEETGTATHLYDLRRGVSGAIIEGLEVLDDGLLVGVTTRNRTIHLFATNPGGGRTDVGSHASGKVRNGVSASQKVHLNPIVRIHGARTPLQSEDEVRAEHAALAFTFINTNDSVAFPASLAPAGSATSLTSSPPLPSSSPLSRSPHLNQPVGGRHPHTQDALLFDALSGTLFLQRITFDSRLKDSRPGTSLSSVSTSLTSGLAAMGMGSVPGMGGAGVLSRSVSSSVSERSGASSRMAAHAARGTGAVARGGVGAGEEVMELVASCSVVATWNLQRGKGWKEIRNPVTLDVRANQRPEGNDEWLAQAELSTFARTSSNIQQRSIYLSHQFSFYTLGEDYQGAIRLYRLAPTGTKIDVRKDIPIQAFPSSISRPEGNEGFVEEFNSPTSPRGMRGIPSSFDEPLASALTHEMEGVGASGVTEVELPMYPNGVPGKRGLLSGSISAIPVRGLGDGVSEGFDRLKKSIRRRTRQGADGQIVEEEMAFEFDETEDGEFMAPRVASLKSQSKQKRSGSHPRSLNSSIHTEIDDDVVGHVDEELWGERGWDDQDQKALDDEEKFQTISKTVPLSPPAMTSSTLGPISLPKVGSSGSIAGGAGAHGSLGKSAGRRKKKKALAAARRGGNGSGMDE